jgi:hypothetical protein
MGKDCNCKKVKEHSPEKKHCGEKHCEERHCEDKHVKKHCEEKHCEKKHDDKQRCCVPVEKSVDCCNPAYQRLASIRTSLLLNSVDSLDNEHLVTEFHFDSIKARNGHDILVPDTNSATIGSVVVGGAYWVNNPLPFVNHSVSYSRYEADLIIPNTGRARPVVEYENAYLGYLLANKLGYAKWEKCAQRDQVYGWYANTNNECQANIQLFQKYRDVPVNATLINLWNAEPTDTFICYKAELLNLLDLTLKGLKEIGGTPKTEGNIVVVKDKKHKWLLLIAPASTNIDVCEENSEYVVFGVILC